MSSGHGGRYRVNNAIRMCPTRGHGGRYRVNNAIRSCPTRGHGGRYRVNNGIRTCPTWVNLVNMTQLIPIFIYLFLIIISIAFYIILQVHYCHRP